MENNNVKSCIVRLINQLKINQNKGDENITVFLGAGCSLGCSQNNITTHSIISRLVASHLLEEDVLPKDWVELYKMFVNTVWAGQGSSDKIKLLSPFFENMELSDGYKCLRYFAENGYVNNILTTNFDPMIDRALDGLSYHLMVGKQTQLIGEHPRLTVIKAHGDLKHGELRFAPKELNQLPDCITSSINKITKGIVLVIGYRGQDNGIINALNTSDDHCAYWINIEKPDEINDYENGALYNWLAKRNSENNIICGKYGDFNQIMVYLKQQILIKNQNINGHKFPKSWTDTYISELLSFNKRFYNLFIILDSYIGLILKNLTWNSEAPYFAKDYKTLLKFYINTMQESMIPKGLLGTVSNEFISLIFAISIEINAACQGYAVTIGNLVSLLKERYQSECKIPILCESFWDIIQWISSADICLETKTFTKSYSEIKISFDKEENFNLILKRIQLSELRYLLSTLKTLLLFTETADVDAQYPIVLTAKKMLQNSLRKIEVCDNTITIFLIELTEETYDFVFEALLKAYFVENRIGAEQARRILNNRSVYVELNLKKSTYQQLSIYDELVYQSNIEVKTFCDIANVHKYVETELLTTITDFVNSSNNNLFIIGGTGSGKSSSLKLWITLHNKSNYILFPFSGQNHDLSSMGMEAFNVNFSNSDFIMNLNTMLKQREQTLILFYDAFNEINGTFDFIVSNFKCILQFCDFISAAGLRHIRFVITMRSGFYYRLKQAMDWTPSSDSFYTIISKDGITAPVYELKGFTDNESQSYLIKNNLTNLQDKFDPYLWNEYKLVPMFLSIMASISEDESVLFEHISVQNIFGKWFQTLLNKVQYDKINSNLLVEIPSTIIFLKYVKAETQSISKQDIFNYFYSSGEGEIDTAIAWLIANRLLKENVKFPNKLLFFHDSLEEFFLCEYLYKQPEFLSVMDELLSLNPKNMMVEHAIINALSIKYRNDPLNYINTAVCILRNEENNKILLIIKSIFALTNDINWKELYNKIYIVLQQYMDEKLFYILLKKTLILIKHYTDDFIKLNGDIFKILFQIINTSDVAEVVNYDLRIYLEYTYADYLYVFSDQNEQDIYEKAKQHCKKALSITSDRTPVSLIDEINVLYATLLRYEGDLNQAITLLKNVYSNQLERGFYEYACKSALELGAMLREMTQFDEALQIYTSIDELPAQNNLLTERLHMNMGIIYKNKLQINLYSGDSNPDVYLPYYQRASMLFKTVYEYAFKANSISLILEILAEMIEMSGIAYTMGIKPLAEMKDYVELLEEYTPKYPVPVRQIQLCRMKSRYLELKEEFNETISLLNKGFSIALQYNIPFRAADCCNQITSILCKQIQNENFINIPVLQDGCKYIEYSINYYKTLHFDTHTYLQHAYSKQEIIHKKLEELLSYL